MTFLKNKSLLIITLILMGVWGSLIASSAKAGVMTRETMVKAFPAPFIVGEKDRDLPVWPILKQDATATPIVAYAFESMDLAAIPGFSGTPFNLLVALDAKGEFMDVKVLSQHEPVFLDGLGEAPLLRFVAQYKGLSLKQSIKIGANPDRDGKAGGANAYIDGVAKATASVRILNQSLLASALKVARAKLGYGEGRDPDLIARIRPELYTAMDWDALVDAGLIVKKTFKNSEIDQAFVGTVGEGVDAIARQSPEDVFISLYFAYLSVPTVGRNLLTPEGWQFLQRRLDPGDHALLLIGSGRYSLAGDNFVRGAVPDRLTLQQSRLPIEIRDLDLDTPLKLPDSLKTPNLSTDWRVFRVIAPAGLDPSQALDFELHVTRAKGLIYPERIRKAFALSAQLPDKFYESASSDSKTWHSIWTARWWELAVLVAALGLLAWALQTQSWLVHGAGGSGGTGGQRRLTNFRTGYLLFTLFFIGWYAQGQLSIVNITAVVQAMIAGRNLNFFLYDPMTVLLWAFVAVTFVLWGRGTFCGWLCPFGALQELVSQVTAKLGLRQIRLSERTDKWLKRVKFGVLAVILVSACFSVTLTDSLVEIEPFKTSITLNFVRAWPFVVWAMALVLLSSFVYKGYCRYLCPLGAGMVVLGRFRMLSWITRRSECGQPCQRCRSDCAYQAITKQGTVDYDECFQCMDCVVIYESDELCVPLIVTKRRANEQVVIPIIPVSVTSASASA